MLGRLNITINTSHNIKIHERIIMEMLRILTWMLLSYSEKETELGIIIVPKLGYVNFEADCEL